MRSVISAEQLANECLTLGSRESEKEATQSEGGFSTRSRLLWIKPLFRCFRGQTWTHSRRVDKQGEKYYDW